MDAVDRLSVGDVLPLFSSALVSPAWAVSVVSPERIWGGFEDGEFTADVSMVIVGARSLRMGVDGVGSWESDMMNPRFTRDVYVLFMGFGIKTGYSQ
jgi:hypothetical protein